MYKVLIIPVLLFCSSLSVNNSVKIRKLTAYENNLKAATELYLSGKDIPENVLLGLAPKNDIEFGLYYATTYPDQKMSETAFFYNTSELIFKQVVIKKNDKFYLPSLRLISFADGEYAEGFTDYLEIIIAMDKAKFCKSIRGKEYTKSNPIKWYAESNKCK